MSRLDLDRIRAARDIISPIFLDSPQVRCEALDELLGCRLSVKLETANPIRCFKGRGSEVVVDNLVRAHQPSVVCSSAGNMGQGLAWSARQRDVQATVVASQYATPSKLARIRALGAELELVDGDHELARSRATAIAQERGIRLLEDSLDIETCEGAATIGLEIVESAARFDTVLLALGGGALATGVGSVIKALAPGTEVVCVQPEGAPALTLSFRSKAVVTTETAETIADGVAGRFPIAEVLADLLEVADDAILVQEQSIVDGMRLLFSGAGVVAEPSGALGVAAILENAERFAGREVLTVICGSNVDTDRYLDWVGRTS